MALHCKVLLRPVAHVDQLWVTLHLAAEFDNLSYAHNDDLKNPITTLQAQISLKTVALITVSK